MPGLDPNKFSSMPQPGGGLPQTSLPQGGLPGGALPFSTTPGSYTGSYNLSAEDDPSIWQSIFGKAKDAWNALPSWVKDGITNGIPAAIAWVKDHWQTLAGVGAAADAVYNQLQAQNAMGDAVKFAKERWAAEQPLRDAGMKAMLNAGAANPFSRAAQAGGTGGALPVSGSPTGALPGGIPWHTGVIPGQQQFTGPTSQQTATLTQAPGDTSPMHIGPLTDPAAPKDPLTGLPFQVALPGAAPANSPWKPVPSKNTTKPLPVAPTA